MAELPSYDELPDGKAWDLWADEFGSLNLLTPERVKAGLACVERGAVFAMNWDMELPDPPLFGRSAFQHDVHWLPNEVGHDDFLGNWNTQSSSQWDGFRHIQHTAHGFYGGVADEDHGIHHWARRGIAGRAVLVDVARWRESAGRPIDYAESDPIEPSDVLDTLSAQGSDFEPGDILLLRTGWTTWYESIGAEDRIRLANDLKAPGLRPGEATARMLWDLHPAAVAADNPALEVWPPGSLATAEEFMAAVQDPAKSPEIFVHFALLPLLGIPIGEMWNLGPLADDCAADGRYHVMLTSAPLNLKAGVASPPNALALK